MAYLVREKHQLIELSMNSVLLEYEFPIDNIHMHPEEKHMKFSKAKCFKGKIEV